MSMGAGAARRAQWVVLSVLGWAAAAHLASMGVGPADLHLGIAITPLLVTGVIVAWRSPLGPAGTVLLTAVALGLLAWAWPGLSGDVAWLYYLQHLCIHLALASWFGYSLVRGHEPVVTAMTRMIFGDQLTPGQRRYTRGVTWAWALFLLGNAALSTALFALAPLATWSVHANLLTGPLVAAFFLIEMLVRRIALPAAQRSALRDVVRVFRAYGFKADGRRPDPTRTTP